ncbi:hypothetical protein [Pseudooceanicola onchidii]|uniref:hypothetical protein n=1 Tax=Pseudooceanicola onchidii TaxID=2562279 RepID=UPI0010AB22E2|nr:hypothetical protein [Pseudooceanicola onchidii]
MRDTAHAPLPGARKTVDPKRLLSWLTRGLRRPPARPDDPHPMTLESLRSQISLTVIAGHPDRRALAQHIRPAYRDWQAQNWAGLGQRLSRLDQRHTALPSGERMAPALGQALFRHLVGARACQIIDRGQGVTDEDLPDTLFAPLDRALSRPDTPPAIHLFAAQIHLETSWARRGETHAELTPDDALAATRRHISMARQILDGISDRSAGSAFHAELDYRLRAAEGSTEEALTEAALRWSTADPTALTPHAVHGLHLLPRWYGSDHALAGYADKIWSDTHTTLDAAGYAACYLSAMEADPSVLLTLDIYGFRDGLIDMMQQSDDPDVTCNAILRVLWEVGSETHGADARESTALRRARRDLRSVFAYLVHHALGPVMPDVWGRGWNEDRILPTLAEAFAPDIAEGRHIAIGMEGVVISDPA